MHAHLFVDEWINSGSEIMRSLQVTLDTIRMQAHGSTFSLIPTSKSEQ